MRNLINFLLRHSSWIVLAIYVAISCVLLVGRNPYQRSIYLSSANQVASAVYDLQSEVTSYFGLREVNRDLQLRNGELEMEVINLKEQLNRYRSSVGKDTIPFDSVLHDYDFAVARVVNNSVAQINNYITIDKGRAEGIEPEMGVVDQNGVVGIINVVGEHHSVAISVLNPKLRLSCKVKGSDYFGSLVWDAVSPRYAVLEEMPRHVEFAPGDTIVTSGYSSVFPEGIMVGIISDYKKQRDDNFYTLRVELSSDFSGLGNNIHLLGVAIPFLYIYFIIRLPLSLSVNWTLTLAFILGLVIDIFSNTPGMNALACTVVAFLRKPILNLYTPRGEDYSESEPSIRNFGMSLFVRYVLTFSLCFCTLLFVIESFSFFDIGRLIVRILASTILTFLVILGMDSLTKSGREKRL